MMEKKRIAVSGEEIIDGRLDFTIMRKIYCIVRLVVWKNQLMNSMKNFWNLVVFLEPEIK